MFSTPRQLSSLAFPQFVNQTHLLLPLMHVSLSSRLALATVKTFSTTYLFWNFSSLFPLLSTLLLASCFYRITLRIPSLSPTFSLASHTTGLYFKSSSSRSPTLASLFRLHYQSHVAFEILIRNCNKI